jgi:hypothetical protein
MTLTCALSDYDSGRMKTHLAAVVPEHSTHEITDNLAINTTTGIPGRALVSGIEIILEYRDKVRITGEIIVQYKIRRETGMAFVRTRALQPEWLGSSPEKNGVALITGTCREN